MVLSVSHSSESKATPGWLLLPRLAFGGFVIALAALLWLSHLQDEEEQRSTLITDMLWLEQNIRFQLTRNEELLGRLSPLPARFSAEAHALIANNTGLRQIFFMDPEGRVRLASPSAESAQLIGEAQAEVPSQSTRRLVQSLGSPAYVMPYPIIGNDWQLEVHTPVITNGRATGVAVGIYSVQRLIEESVPWWLAERYRIAVIDGNGKELATRSKVLPVAEQKRYELPFDPPGFGLLLSARPYQTPFHLLDRLLAVVVVLLAVATIVSLWMMRQHVLQRIRAEEALKAEYRFRQAMERSVQTGLRARDMEGRILYVNQAFCAMVGWPAEELVGRTPPMPYWPEDEVAEIRSVHDQILSGDGPAEGFELHFRRRSGEVFTVLIHEAPLIDESGRQTGWMGSILDISDRKSAEERAAQQQERLQVATRLAAIGEMASGMAHELNQPLAAISSYCSGALRLLRERHGDIDLVQALEKAVEQTRRAGEVVRRIYRLARRESGTLTDVSLQESIATAISLIEQPLRRQGVRIDKPDGANDLRVLADAVLLEQALFNLLRNAVDAMTETPQTDRAITITLKQQDAYACIGIADRGGGITKEHSERIFSPLFTTKAEGLGMGLSIARSAVETLKGRLWFEPNPGGGTIFSILLPLYRVEA